LADDGGEAKGGQGIASRVVRALAFRGDVYDEVAEDPRATRQAWVAVLLVAIAAGAGEAPLAPQDLALQGIASLGHWWIWTAATYLTGTKLMGGSASWSAVLRALAFAKVPGVFAALAPVPAVGGLIHAATLPAVLAAGVVAARRTLKFGFGRALAAVLPGALIYWTVPAFLF